MQQKIDIYKILRSCEHYIINKCPKCKILIVGRLCPNCATYPLKEVSLWVGNGYNLEDRKIGYNAEYMSS